MTKLTILLCVAAVVACVPSTLVSPVVGGNDVSTDSPDAGKALQNETFSNGVDGDRHSEDNNVEIDGISLPSLTLPELNEFLDDKDIILAAEFDILAAKKILEAGNTNRRNAIGVSNSQGRQKRWGALLARLFTAGRSLFQGSVRTGVPTRNGQKLTQQYTRQGNYNDAVRDFNKLNLNNVKQITSSKPINGQTGTIGNHRVTVRDLSSEGSPTLEVTSPMAGGKFVRKFRYHEK